MDNAKIDRIVYLLTEGQLTSEDGEARLILAALQGADIDRALSNVEAYTDAQEVFGVLLEQADSEAAYSGLLHFLFNATLDGDAYPA